MGSRALERAGHRVLAYDARGHGARDPAPDARGLHLRGPRGRPASRARRRAGSSARCSPARRWARTPRCASRSSTPSASPASSSSRPAYDPEAVAAATSTRWDALSDGLRDGGVDGFVAAYGDPRVTRRGARRCARCCASASAAHEHPEAVADALRAVPRSRPFAALRRSSRAIAVPTVVVADRDERRPRPPARGRRGVRRADPRRAARRRGRARARSPGRAAQLSKVIAELAARGRGAAHGVRRVALRLAGVAWVVVSATACACPPAGRDQAATGQANTGTARASSRYGTPSV